MKEKTSQRIADIINYAMRVGIGVFMCMGLIDLYSENPSGARLQYFIEKGRQEIIEEAGQCAARSFTLEECASNNGWDLKNG